MYCMLPLLEESLFSQASLVYLLLIHRVSWQFHQSSVTIHYTYIPYYIHMLPLLILIDGLIAISERGFRMIPGRARIMIGWNTMTPEWPLNDPRMTRDDLRMTIDMNQGWPWDDPGWMSHLFRYSKN